MTLRKRGLAGAVRAAAPAVLERYPQARFLLVGKGHLEAALRQQAARLGIEVFGDKDGARASSLADDYEARLRAARGGDAG